MTLKSETLSPSASRSTAKRVARSSRLVITNMTSAAFAEITKFFSPVSWKVFLSIGVAAVTKFSSLHIGLFSVTAKAAMISPDAI